MQSMLDMVSHVSINHDTSVFEILLCGRLCSVLTCNLLIIIIIFPLFQPTVIMSFLLSLSSQYLRLFNTTYSSVL